MSLRIFASPYKANRAKTGALQTMRDMAGSRWLPSPLSWALGRESPGAGVFRGGTTLKAGSKGATFGQGYTRAARFCIGVFQGWKPLRAVIRPDEAGILRDGFGVPSARNIACDV